MEKIKVLSENRSHSYVTNSILTQHQKVVYNEPQLKREAEPFRFKDMLSPLREAQGILVRVSRQTPSLGSPVPAQCSSC